MDDDAPGFIRGPTHLDRLTDDCLTDGSLRLRHAVVIGMFTENIRDICHLSATAIGHEAHFHQRPKGLVFIQPSNIKD